MEFAALDTLHKAGAVLFAVVAALLAKRYGKSPWSWFSIGGVAFLLAELPVRLLFVYLFLEKDFDPFESKSPYLLAAAAASAVVFALLFIGFRAKLRKG